MIFANDGTEPFDPSVPTAGGGYATNSLAPSGVVPMNEEPMVFLGYKPGYGPQKDRYVMPEPIYLPMSEVVGEFDTFNKQEYLKLKNQLIAAGIISRTASPLQVRDAFENVVGRVAEMTASGRFVSPMGYIKNVARLNGVDPDAVDESEDDPFTGKKAYTNRTISDFTEGEAWSAIQSNLQQMLGRDPTDQELRDFTYRMNRLAAENPTITKTIQRYKDGEAVSATTRTNTGFTAADMAQEAYDQAQNDPEYAEYQAAGTYFNALQQALGAIGG